MYFDLIGVYPPPQTSLFSYIQSIYLLLIKYSLCSSLDPLFHSDSIIYDQDRCRGNECISIL